MGSENESKNVGWQAKSDDGERALKVAHGQWDIVGTESQYGLKDYLSFKSVRY